MRKGADKLQKFLNSKQQGRLDSFFSVKPKEKATAPAKGKGKDKVKVDTKAKGTKRKVCYKKTISPPFPLTFFLKKLCREMERKPVQEKNLERNDLIRFFILSKTYLDRVFSCYLLLLSSLVFRVYIMYTFINLLFTSVPDVRERRVHRNYTI